MMAGRSRGPFVWRLARLALALLVVTGALWRAFRCRAGSPRAELDTRWHIGTSVVDRDGRLLRELPSELGARGRELSLASVGPRLLRATLLAEDARFFEHDGVDGWAVLRAAGQCLRHLGPVSGASTITQQLVKLLEHRGAAHPRGPAIKLWEMARAQNLETELSKHQILEAYLARLDYGHQLVGSAAAAEGWFGVAPGELSWAQAAALAVVPRAPSYLDLAAADRSPIVRRQRRLLAALHAAGDLDAASYERALAEPLTPRLAPRPFLAPHFVEAVRREGHGEPLIVTSLDLDLQRDAERLVAARARELAARGARSAAALVVDNATGEVLAWVGSHDFHAPAGQVDVLRSPRQPGSTLKPFVYGLAFEHGHASTDLLADVPVRFSARTGAWEPTNFDGAFLGPISAREALAGSLNVPAVRLAAELGPDALLARLHELGLASLDQPAERYGLALALGGADVTPVELAGAYVALARGGDRVPLVLRRQPHAAVGTRVMPADVAAELSDVLADPLARFRGLHGRGPIDLGFAVAQKTGTSSDFRDAWTVGFTHERTVLVWVGNPDGAVTDGVTGASGAGPLFAALMARAMSDVAVRTPLVPEGVLQRAEVCALSGQLATSACPARAERAFRLATRPRSSCSLHRHVRHDAEGWRCDPRGSSVVAALPRELAPWARARGAREPLSGTPFVAADDLAGCDGAPPARAPELVSPAPGSVVSLPDDPRGRGVLVVARATRAGDRLAVLLDGERLDVLDASGQGFVPLEPGPHRLTVIDPRGETARGAEVVAR